MQIRRLVDVNAVLAEVRKIISTLINWFHRLFHLHAIYYTIFLPIVEGGANNRHLNINELKNHTLAVAPRPNEPLAFAGALAMLAHLTGRSYVDERGTHTNLYLAALATFVTKKMLFEAQFNLAEGKERPARKAFLRTALEARRLT